jgi:LAS superfamily LD-carboxypeptidase LdcB
MDNLNYCLKKLDEEHQKKEAAEQIMQLAAEKTKLIGIEVPKAFVVETSNMSGSSKSDGHPKGSTKAAANQQQLAIQMTNNSLC